MNASEEMEWHPAACIFPMMPHEELLQLSNDIKKNGQKEACVLYEGKMLDGRNRWLACKIAGVEAKTVVTKNLNDPVAYVLSLNLHRRHLTPSQASMCAARARDVYEKQAKERMSEGGKNKGVENLPPLEPAKARDAAGKAFGVSGKSVDHAKRVIEKGIPELAKAVDEGRMAVSTAAILATEPEEIQKAEIEHPKRNRLYKPNRGGGNEETIPPEKVPRHEGEHNKSKLFALNKADVAITQLKGIPAENSYRDAALERVVNWIASQRKV